MNEELIDKLAIRETLQNWVVWRDAADWERFRTVWADEGRMMATWFQGTGDEFVRVSKEGWDKGVNILHTLGACSIEVSKNRAISQTKMSILQRAKVHDVLVDVTCIGRFFDFFEKRGGNWLLVLRQPIYEKDRMDPVDPAAKLTLDSDLLKKCPDGYRHLAYLQTLIGYKVKLDMPGLKGPDTEKLYQRGKTWLTGGSAY
ncbi:MAG: nuclear transport factor 2 family protein [Candidatus Acidiferrales bacterium]